MKTNKHVAYNCNLIYFDNLYSPYKW